MPAFNLETLDDPLVWDACTGFAGGQVSNTRANLLEANQLASLVNCDISQTGEVVTRRGATQIGGGLPGPIQGLAFYDTPATQHLVAAAAGQLWKYDGAAWAALGDGLWRALDFVRPVSFAQGFNLLYFSDGAGHLFSWDGTAVADLGGGASNQPPVGATLLDFHAGRVVAAGIGAEPDAIYFSDLLDGGTWDAALQQLRVSKGEGDPIVAIVPWTNFDLVTLKRHSIWVVGCDPTNASPAGSVSGFPVTLLNRQIGCVAPRSAVQVGEDVFFLSDTGVRSVRRSVATEDRAELGESLSFPIRDLIDRINVAAVSKCCATYWNNRYLLAVPLDDSTVPNTLLVYNTLTETWSGTWIGWQPLHWCVSAFGGSLRLNFGQPNGIVLQWLDWVHPDSEVDETFQDADVPVITSLKTRAFTYREPVSPKTGMSCELEFDGSMATVDVQAILDDAGALELASFLTLSASLFLPLVLPFTLPRAGIVRRSFDLQRYGQFRELQFQINASSGKLVLRTISASAFIDTIALQTNA